MFRIFATKCLNFSKDFVLDLEISWQPGFQVSRYYPALLLISISFRGGGNWQSI